jgi:hypothetical protein
MVLDGPVPWMTASREAVGNEGDGHIDSRSALSARETNPESAQERNESPWLDCNACSNSGFV